MMYLNNIIDQLVDILSVYYISYRKRINKHINISFDDISDKTKTFIKSYISNQPIGIIAKIVNLFERSSSYSDI